MSKIVTLMAGILMYCAIAVPIMMVMTALFWLIGRRIQVRYRAPGILPRPMAWALFIGAAMTFPLVLPATFLTSHHAAFAFVSFLTYVLAAYGSYQLGVLRAVRVAARRQALVMAYTPPAIAPAPYRY